VKYKVPAKLITLIELF